MMPELDHLAIAAWLTTYLLHSTVLLGGVWLFARPRLHPEAEERLWRIALIVPLLTTVMQVSLNVEPVSGRLVVAGGSVQPVPQAVFDDLPTLPHEPPMADVHDDSGSLLTEPDDEYAAAAPMIQATPHADHAAGALSEAQHSEAVPIIPDALRSRLSALPGAGLGVVLGVMVCISLTVVLSWIRLLHVARGRTRIRRGPMLEQLRELLTRARVRRAMILSSSATLRSPVAVGMFRPQIIVPTAALNRLDAAQQRSLLAHELAHHIRWDPLWLALANTIAALLFFQPLNLLASRRLRELAEVNCDAWAARQTGDCVPLARCLTEVASWLVDGLGDRAWNRVPCMARSAGALRTRVARLLNEPVRPLATSHRRGLALLLPVLMLAGTLAIPGVVAHPQAASVAEDPVEIAESGPATLDPMQALVDEIGHLDRRIALLSGGRFDADADEEVSMLIDQLQRRARELRARCDLVHTQWRAYEPHQNDQRPPAERDGAGTTERSEQS